MKKTVFAALLFLVFAALAPSAPPERFMVYFSNAYLIFTNPAKSIQVIAHGNVLSYGSDWQKAQVHPYLYHIRQNDWKGFYFKVNTSRKEAYLVEGTHFGAIGDSSERKLPFNVAVSGGSDTTAPDSFRIQFGQEGCYLVYAPGGGNLQIAAVTNMAPEYPAVVLSYGNDWQVCQISDPLFDFKERFWAGFFWRVDTAARQLFRVEGGSFCKPGSNGEPLHARVHVVGGAGGEEPGQTLGAPRPLAPKCGIEMTQFPRTFTMKWSAVAREATYDVEVDCLHCRKKGFWDSDAGGAYRLQNLESTSAEFTFWGDNQGRWRVRAKAGSQVSAWSPWCGFTFRTSPPAAESGDLVIRIMNCPRHARPGAELRDRFKVFVHNRSSRKLENVPLDIVLRSTSACPPNPGFAVYSENYSDGVLLKGGREHVTLEPEANLQVKLNGTNQIPRDARPGTYFLCAVIDPANSVVETDESNNCACCPIRIEPRR